MAKQLFMWVLGVSLCISYSTMLHFNRLAKELNITNNSMLKTEDYNIFAVLSVIFFALIVLSNILVLITLFVDNWED